DFNVSVEMKDGDFDRFLCELENFYEGFDPDYETYLWIGNDGHGKNGAPYHIKDIVRKCARKKAAYGKRSRNGSRIGAYRNK
ncbi:hypothetical protein LEA_05631, partial [human gut metagenome]